MGERILDVGGKYVFLRFEIILNLWMLYIYLIKLLDFMY